jgi:hypothetical protein
MLQLVLSNAEKSHLRAAIKDMKGTIAAKGNAPLSEREMVRNAKLCTEHFTTLCRLKALLPQIHKQGELGRKARVEFLKTIWLADIKSEVTGYAFFDVFDIGERQYDDCFEMGDSGEVLNELVRLAKRSKNLKAAALSIYSEEEWMRFETRAATMA